MSWLVPLRDEPYQCLTRPRPLYRPSELAKIHMADSFGNGRDLTPRDMRVALLLGPQSADRSVMHSKRPGDIG